jgi:hypothetical protein
MARSEYRYLQPIVKSSQDPFWSVHLKAGGVVAGERAYTVLH